MPQASARATRIDQLGPIPTDILQKFRDNGLSSVQDLQDEGVAGCRALGISDCDIVPLNKSLRDNGFDDLG